MIFSTSSANGQVYDVTVSGTCSSWVAVSAWRADDEPDSTAGVREPRRPIAPTLSTTVARAA